MEQIAAMRSQCLTKLRERQGKGVSLSGFINGYPFINNASKNYISKVPFEKLSILRGYQKTKTGEKVRNFCRLIQIPVTGNLPVNTFYFSVLHTTYTESYVPSVCITVHRITIVFKMPVPGAVYRIQRGGPENSFVTNIAKSAIKAKSKSTRES
jgi:hypothetical protein